MSLGDRAARLSLATIYDLVYVLGFLFAMLV